MFNSLWYENLNRPFLSPPSYIFAPVWTILYALIFASLLTFILKQTDKDKVRGFIYFGIQLALNFAWSPAFFYLKNIGLALIIILLLDIFTILTIKHFYTVSKPAGILLIPYFVWIAFATYLNIAYFVLN